MLWKRPGESVIIRQSCSDKVSQTSDFNKRNDFLIITEPGSPRSGVSRVVSLKNSLWQQALFVPGVSPCSPSLCICAPVSQYNDTTQIGIGLFFRIVLCLNYCFKDPVSEKNHFLRYWV